MTGTREPRLVLEQWKSTLKVLGPSEEPALDLKHPEMELVLTQILTG